MDNPSPITSDPSSAEILVNSTTLPFHELKYFSKIIVDYIEGKEELRSFYEHPVSYEGIQSSMNNRKQFNTDRQTLVRALEEQYEGVTLSKAVKDNISSLKAENTFTITTAHQPNIFTGYLYFIYKILHVIKLASSLNDRFPGNHFVPVFYMGSEDADLDELGSIYLDGEKITWNTCGNRGFECCKKCRDTGNHHHWRLG